MFGELYQTAETSLRDQARASESEPFVRKLKHSDGGCSPSYNVQVMTEASLPVIVGITVSDAANDVQELVDGVKMVEQNLSQKPSTLVADGSYASRSNVEGMAKEEVVFVASWKSEESRQAGVQNKHEIESAFGPDAFVEAGDELRCPSGKVLTFAGVRILHDLPHRIYEADADDFVGSRASARGPSTSHQPPTTDHR